MAERIPKPPPPNKAGRTRATPGKEKETPARKKARLAAAKQRKGQKSASPEKLRRLGREGHDISNARAIVHVGQNTTRILTGQEDLTSWTDEELERGQKMSKNGTWTGRPPQVIPKIIHDELVKRTLSKAQELLRSNLLDAVAALTSIAKDEDAPEGARIQAATLIMERVMGKTPEKVEISAEMPWMDALTDAIVSTEDDFVANALDVESRETTTNEEMEVDA